MKGYPSGMRRNLITILNRDKADTGRFGIDTEKVSWSVACHTWASVDWQKGKTALNAGAIDSYGVVLVRMNWNSFVTMRSRIVHEGMQYQILPETFHADKQANQIQFMAQATLESYTSSASLDLTGTMPENI